MTVNRRDVIILDEEDDPSAHYSTGKIDYSILLIRC